MKNIQCFLIIGDENNSQLKINSLLKSKGHLQQNQKIDSITIEPEKDSIGIDIIKNIKETIYQKPLRSKFKSITIYKADTLTNEAQNALLKILEEPPPYALIFLTAKTKENFLPTILSRITILNTKRVNLKSDIPQINFAANSRNIQNISEHLDNPIKFIDSQIIILYRLIITNNDSLNALQKIDELIEAKKMIKANVDKRFVLANLFIFSAK